LNGGGSFASLRMSCLTANAVLCYLGVCDLLCVCMRAWEVSVCEMVLSLSYRSVNIIPNVLVMLGVSFVTVCTRGCMCVGRG